MSGRNVALLMDNFYAHQAAVTEIQCNGYPLQNTLTILHPADSKSRYQPLDSACLQHQSD